MFRYAFLLLAIAVAAAQGPKNPPFPAYRVIGNVYYVGTTDITVYLITGPAGHILVNSGYQDTPPLVRDSFEKLGFHPHDVKILLNSQAHWDHVAGQAAMQKLTGAKIYSSQPEVAVLQSGGRADPRWGKEQTYPVVKVDHVVRDGEEVKLGTTTVVAHMTPGHSIGCTTWTTRVSDGGKFYDVVIVGGTTINPGVRFVHQPTYPGIAEDYARTFRVLRALHCDIFLGAHGGYYGMEEKYRKMAAGGPNPFLDPEGYAAFIDKSEKTYLDAVAKERAGR